jgi:hypothetical protein
MPKRTALAPVEKQAMADYATEASARVRDIPGPDWGGGWGDRSFPEPPEKTMILGIDPGDVHCGIATARASYDDATREGRIEVIRSLERTPGDCVDLVAAWCLEGWVDAVAIERFTLYGDKAQLQTGSEMLTAQTIGALRYVIRLCNRERRDNGLREIPVHLQGADLKKSMRAQCKARGIDLIPAPADHERDAQLHSVAYAMRYVLGWGR